MDSPWAWGVNWMKKETCFLMSFLPCEEMSQVLPSISTASEEDGLSRSTWQRKSLTAPERQMFLVPYRRSSLFSARSWSCTYSQAGFQLWLKFRGWRVHWGNWGTAKCCFSLALWVQYARAEEGIVVSMLLPMLTLPAREQLGGYQLFA